MINPKHSPRITSQGSPVCSIPVLQVSLASPSFLQILFVLASVHRSALVVATSPGPATCPAIHPGEVPLAALAATQNWPLGMAVTNRRECCCKPAPSPCFGFVSDLPAQSRGRLLSGVGRTGFMATLPTLSDPRLSVSGQTSSRLRLYTSQKRRIHIKQSE